MPAEFFYRDAGGNSYGPFSDAQIKDLAASGAITPGDTLWKSGESKTTLARDIKGLFPSAPTMPPPLVRPMLPPAQNIPRPTTPSVPPPVRTGAFASAANPSAKQEPIPAAQFGSLTSNVINEASHSSLPPTNEQDNTPFPDDNQTIMDRARLAGKRISNQLQKTKLVNLTLPQLFHQLGEQLAAKGAFRNELPELWAVLDENRRQLDLIQAASANATTPHGFVEQAKLAAVRAADLAQSKLIQVRQSSAITQLGTTAFERFSSQIDEPQLVQAIRNAQAQLAQVTESIAPPEVGFIDTISTERSRSSHRKRNARRTNSGKGGGRRYWMYVLAALALFGGIKRLVGPQDGTGHKRSTATAAGVQSDGIGTEKPAISDGQTASDRPRQITVNVDTAGIENMAWWIGKQNASLTNVKCTATDGELVIEFGVDRSQWTPVAQTFPLLVRLFDGNGQYLTHFTTGERFTVHDIQVQRSRMVYERLMRAGARDDAAEYNCKLLKAAGNRFVYTVNKRDLRDTHSVEIGFIEP